MIQSIAHGRLMPRRVLKLSPAVSNMGDVQDFSPRTHLFRLSHLPCTAIHALQTCRGICSFAFAIDSAAYAPIVSERAVLGWQRTRANRSICPHLTAAVALHPSIALEQ